MEKKYYAPNIPRFTKADCEKMAQKFFKAKITETLTFEDIKWHFGRMVTIGDSAHKVTPNLGQGGNSCIESVAEFSNILNRAVSKEKSGKLSSEKITAVFQEFQESRMQRVKQVFDVSARVTRLQARDGLKWKLFGDFVLPYLSEEFVMQDTVNLIEHASKLDYVDKPYRHGVRPWGDSPEANKIKRSRFELLLGCSLFAGLTAVAVRTLQIAGTRNGTFEMIGKVVHDKFFEDEGIPMKNTFTGIGGVDKTLATLVAAFTTSTEGFDQGYSLFAWQFIVTLLPVIAIWTIEGRRMGNFLTVAAFPTFFAVMYQLFGIGSIAPVFYLLHFLQMDGARIHHRPNYRHVPLEFAKTLLPTLILCYGIPTALLYAPHSLISDIRTRQLCNAIWQAFPVYIPVVHRYLSSWCSRDRLKSYQTEPTFATTDMKYLRFTYLFTFAVAAFAHIWATLKSIFSSNPSLGWHRVWTLILPSIDQPVVSTAEGVHRLMHFDYYISFAAGILFVLLAVADLKRAGKTQIGWATAVISVVGGWFLVGPGAVMAAAWAWREEILAFGGKTKEIGKVKDL